MDINFQLYIWLYFIIGIIISIMSLIIRHLCKKDITIGLIFLYIVFLTIWPITLYFSVLNFIEKNIDKIKKTTDVFLNIVIFKGRK
jgi:hypothetical protein